MLNIPQNPNGKYSNSCSIIAYFWNWSCRVIVFHGNYLIVVRNDWRYLPTCQLQILTGQPIIRPRSGVQPAVLRLCPGERPAPPRQLSPGRRATRGQNLPVPPARWPADGDDKLVRRRRGVLVKAGPHLEPRELAAEAPADGARADTAQGNAWW